MPARRPPLAHRLEGVSLYLEFKHGYRRRRLDTDNYLHPIRSGAVAAMMESRTYKGIVIYEPSLRVAGWYYFTIGRILYVIWESINIQMRQGMVIDEAGRKRLETLQHAAALCSDALDKEPTGLELRNDYLLPIRTDLQEWSFGAMGSNIIGSMCKLLLTAILDDSVATPEDGTRAAEGLTLYTRVAYDPSKQLHRRLE